MADNSLQLPPCEVVELDDAPERPPFCDTCRDTGEVLLPYVATIDPTLRPCMCAAGDDLRASLEDAAADLYAKW